MQLPYDNTIGQLHSVQSLGALDGPGLRTVVILQGCGFKCKFCHSIDTTLTDRGEKITVDELTTKILSNKPYWSRYLSTEAVDGIAPHLNLDPEKVGGVTITGGDPAVQPEFVKNLLIALKNHSVHTAVESPLLVSQTVIDSWMPYVDLWMISLKHMDNATHKEICGRENEVIHNNIKYLDESLSTKSLADGSKGKIRIRYVLMPGLHDDMIHLNQMGKYVQNIKNLEVFEFLPYTSMGRFKWIDLYGSYELDHIKDATKEDVEAAKKIMIPYGFAVR